MIIAIGNRARNGKGTAAEAIVEHCDRIMKPVLHIGWADALRNEVTNAIREYGGNVKELLMRGVQIDEDRDGFVHHRIPSWVEAESNPIIELLSPYGKHPKLLQWWGTDYRRAQDVNYWVKQGMQTVNNFIKKYPNGVVLISDTRFLNEAQAVKDAGGVILLVSRINNDGTFYRDPSRDPDHISETQLDNYNADYHITSKSAALTSELAITTFEYIRGLKGL